MKIKVQTAYSIARKKTKYIVVIDLEFYAHWAMSAARSWDWPLRTRLENTQTQSLIFWLYRLLSSSMDIAYDSQKAGC